MMSGVPLETCCASKNFGMVNSITELHLIGISAEFPILILFSTPWIQMSFSALSSELLSLLGL